MKKIILLTLITIISVMASAQTGWTRDYILDEYTQEKSPICVYYNRQGVIQAVYYINDHMFKVIRHYDGLKYFQVTWDAL